LPAAYNAIGQTKILGIQSPIWITLFFIIVGDILLRKSRFFRQNYFIGGNEKTARLSGIPVSRMKIMNYMFTGLFAGMAGIIMSARLGAAAVTAANGLELKVITAVIIGGASLAGGEGSVLGAFFGSFLMSLIVNALTLLGVDVYWQTFVTGATLLVAVLIDRVGKIRREWKALRKAGV
jgi:ribose transport system permease protein